MLGSRRCILGRDPSLASAKRDRSSLRDLDGGRGSPGGTSRFPQTPFHWSASADEGSALDQKNSPSRFRFRPPLPLTFAFRLLPSDSVSTYLRSVLGASGNLTCRARGSRGRKRSWPQFADFSFFNISTALLPTCGQGCGSHSRTRRRSVQQVLQRGSRRRTA